MKSIEQLAQEAYQHYSTSLGAWGIQPSYWHLISEQDQQAWIAATRYSVKQANRVPQLQEESAQQQLTEAALTYYQRYVQDEADDDGVENTGCTQQQHQDAKALRDALIAMRRLAN